MEHVPNISVVVQHDLCIGCGICQNVCPQSVISIGVQRGMFCPTVDERHCNNAKGCHVCHDVCPGLGVDLKGMSQDLYDGEGIKEDKYIGRYLQCYTGYSADETLRYHAASGGVVSQFLIWLIENKKIDGVVVVRFERNAPMKVRTFIATTREDIVAAKSSKYAPVTHARVAREVKKAPGKRYVVVGVPCQIEGWRKMMARDRALREKITGLFSIYCSGSRTFYFTEYLMKNRGIDLEKVDYLAYRDNGCLGGMVVRGDGIDYYEDYQRYSHPLRTIFYPRRCLLCADHFGELADVCFGDIHVKPYSEDKIGINSLIVRSSQWDSLLHEVCDAGVLIMDNLDERQLLASQKMAKVKKKRNIAFILLNRKMGRLTPDFGSSYEATITLKDIVNYFRMGIERYIGNHSALWGMIPLIKSKAHVG